MAIYHVAAQTFSRARGQNIVAAAAYRAGLNLVDENGVRHDYRRRGKVEGSICIAPMGSPDWSIDPQELWVNASKAEKRRDATVGREFEVALPHELDTLQRWALVKDMCKQLVGRFGFALQASVHTPRTPEELNWHVHILTTTRRMSPQGLDEKVRELDGGPSGRAEINWVREMIAGRINAHLTAAEVDARVDHRTLEQQAKSAEKVGDFESAAVLSRDPTKHLGKAAAAMLRRGEVSGRGLENEAIERENEHELRARLEDLERLGVMMPAPPSHSAAAARRERLAAQRSTPQVLTDAQLASIGLSRPRRVAASGAIAGPVRVLVQRNGTSKSEREREIERWLLEALKCWLEGIQDATRQSNMVVELLLAQREDLIRHYGHRVSLHRDCRDLNRAMASLAKEQKRWPSSMEAGKRAQMELEQARLGLIELESPPSRLHIWSRRQWAQRRREQERRVAYRKAARDEAREATSPEAQTKYVRDEERALGELKKIAERMVSQYPIAAELVPIEAQAPEPEAEPQADHQGRAKGRVSPRQGRSKLK